MEKINFKFKKIRDVKTPTRGTEFSAGLDFYIPNDVDKVVVQPGKDVFIASGIKIDMMCQPVALIVFNKSSIAVKYNLTVGACVVDSDYQGEIFIHLFNNGDKIVTLTPGQKITQLIAVPIYYPEMIETDDLFLTETTRKNGCLGSTNSND